MKPLLIITLFLLALSACAPAAPQPAILPADTVVPGGPALGASATPQVKVVEMATQTAVEATLPPTPAPTTPVQTQPTPASEATGSVVELPKTLEELGIPATTYEDKVAGLALDYPSAWEISTVPEADRSSAMIYTASLRSPHAARGPKQQEGIPPDMAAIDLTVYNSGPKTLEQAIAERRASATTNESGIPIQIALEEDWVLRDGLATHRFLYNLGKDPLGGYGDRDKMSSELVTIINGKMVLVSGAGDLSLFNVVAASLREIK